MVFPHSCSPAFVKRGVLIEVPPPYFRTMGVVRLYMLNSAGPQIFIKLLGCDENWFRNAQVSMQGFHLMVKCTLNCLIEDVKSATFISADQCYSGKGTGPLPNL